jgi:hypothetical protein
VVIVKDVKSVQDVKVKKMKGAGLLALLALCLLAPAAAGAQELAPPRLTISAGYQFMHDPSWDTQLTLGWVGTITQKLNERTFVVAEGSGGYGEITGGFMVERYAILGGFKVQPPGDGPRIFIQALAGLSRQAGDPGIKNGFIAQPGGGVEWPVNARLNGRAFGDYRFLREDGQNYHGYRIGGALVFVLWR